MKKQILRNSNKSCEMCGKQSVLIQAKVEGALLSVCAECAKFGSIVRRNSPQQYTPRNIIPEKEVMEVLVPDFGKRIMEKRLALGMEHEHLARKMAEKVSVIQKVETEQLKPDTELAKKFEQALKISLIEKHEEIKHQPKEKSSSSSSGILTIGDIIALKQKKT